MKQLYFVLIAVAIFAGCQPQEEIIDNSTGSNQPTQHANANKLLPNSLPEEVEIGETDTIEADRYSLYFGPVEGTEIESLFTEDSTLVFPEGISNGYEYAQLIESTKQPNHNDKFRRSGDTLWLLLQNGQELMLKDSINKAVYDFNDYAYTLHHYFPEQEYYLVRVQFGEGNGFMLINRKNGFKKYVFGEPYFSPSGKYIVTLSSDLEAGYNPTGIQLLLNQGDTLSEQIKVYIRNWGPTDLKWLADNEFILQKEHLEPDSIAGIKYVPSWSRVIIQAK